MAKSTKIIAALGVAGALGIAALPMASYAANADTIVDTVKITLTGSCAFQTYDNSTEEYTAMEKSDTSFTETLTNKSEKVFTEKTFNVYCNLPGGYDVTAVATDLQAYSDPTARSDDKKIQDSSNNDIKIGYVANGDYKNDDSAPTLGNWTAVLTAGDRVELVENAAITKTANNKIVHAADGSKNVAGESFKVQYKVYVGQANPAGTYEGTVTYSLVQPAA